MLALTVLISRRVLCGSTGPPEAPIVTRIKYANVANVANVRTNGFGT